MKIIPMIRKIWQRIFRQRDATLMETPKAKHSPRRAKGHHGTHYYLGDILERLDDVFKDLPKLRKIDPEAYQLYRKVGATVVSSEFALPKDLEPAHARNMPGFGCLFLGGNNNGENLGLRFGIFSKEKRPINVQPANDDIFRVTMTYLDGPHVIPAQFFVAFGNGGVRALKVYQAKRYYSAGAHSRMEWRFPDFLSEKAVELGQSIDEVATELFSIIVNGAGARDGGMTVTASRGGLSAVFSIDMLRTPYFFSDREKTVNESGQTKKIIHIVKGHYRTSPDGGKTFVKSHFRGLRNFDWNGYKIRVGLGGKHGGRLSDFTAPIVDPMQPDDQGLIGVADMADRLKGSLA